MIFSYLLNMQSHPSWVCGLKPGNATITVGGQKSHPSWVCGLKQTKLYLQKEEFCHTLRGCVD